jgi:hypothetical protein
MASLDCLGECARLNGNETPFSTLCHHNSKSGSQPLKMSLRQSLKTGDYMLVILLGLFSLVSWELLHHRESGNHALIYEDGNQIADITLGSDQTIQVRGPLGISVIEVKNGKIRMAASPCPQQICVRMGQISKAHSSIVCVPNRIVIQIPADHDSLDAITL